MSRRCSMLAILTVAAVVLVAGNAYAQTAELRLDPLLLVSLKECRNIGRNLPGGLFPGWDFERTPVLFYKPNVQEMLINFPRQPRGYARFTGFNPLGDEPIYVRNDTTLITADDQNTSREVDGVTVLVVADPSSRMRNQIRGTFLNHPQDVAERWLDQWNFVPSPYDELQLILHEAFHVHQSTMAPGKEPNELAITQYPLLDPTNNALFVLEGNILRDALLARDSSRRLEKTKQFVAVRGYRQSRLDSSFVEYENLMEFSEGLAKYVEYAFMRRGESVVPVKEMCYRAGFDGYRGVLPRRFEKAMHEMVNIVAVNDDRFGNKFGSGPLRFKLYETGACQAMLLDETRPDWKKEIFGAGVFLSDLLAGAVHLTAAERERYLAKAKAEYGFDEVYQGKLAFESEGRKKIDEKLARILQSDGTLVRISYGGCVERIGLGGFTPFGVTQVGKRAAIYDLAAIRVLFKDGVELQMKRVIPVLVDREKKVVAFAVRTPIAELGVAREGAMETEDFRLSYGQADLRREGKTLEIRLK